MSEVFVLQHLYRACDGDEESKLPGVYSSRQLAHRAAQRFGRQPGFREHPEIVAGGDGDGFYIQAYRLEQDSDGWSEGFVRE
ncbi:hypothetical protein [Lysobacter enzymogenes]|uniref:Uncharacterized protein n=1 Tax=Lysobacter enzymogenes TaxID=69 RepID=A0A3N2RKI9_LYSEN|nr:hypothetical protein [Lysobacter enzymogenes]ROU07963.1 hypothetical protein D9T17_07145 [Lysobacter enzymogenes]